MSAHYTTTIKKLDNSELEITGEITSDFFESMRAGALEAIGNSVKIDGFRPGKIPEKILLEKVGEMAVLEEMAERAISATYPDIISDNKIDAIGRPNVSITKIASKNPLGFVIKQTIMPEVKLPDYKKIAVTINKEKVTAPGVTDEEVEGLLMDIRKSRTKEGEALLELTDEVVKTFGNFSNVEEFKNRIRENLRLEKEYKEKDKHRIKLIDGILEKTELTLPEVLIERELDNAMTDMRSRVYEMGIEFKEYLEKIKKTEEELRKESRDGAIKRAKTGLILHAIATAEAITPINEELDAETDRVLEMYKGADPKAVRHYVEGILKNDGVFKFLEETK